MSYEEVQKVWMNGRLVDFADAKIHSFSHVFHYGSAMFEGTRVYDTRNGPAAFRLDEHIERLYHSCKVYRMEIPYTPEEFRDAIFETIRANGFGACYIRPVVYRGLGALGVNPFKSPVDVVIAVLALGQVPGRGGDRERRGRLRLVVEPDGAEHVPGDGQGDRQLPELRAHQDGGPRQRIHRRDRARQRRPDLGGQRREHLPRVRRPDPDAAARRHDPARDHARLDHACSRETRATRSSSSRSPREMLYIADEVFFTGTAAEITPIRSVDRIPVGSGRRGTRHRAPPEGVLRAPRGGGRGPLRLVDADPVAAGVRSSEARDTGYTRLTTRRGPGDGGLASNAFQSPPPAYSRPRRQIHAHQRSAEDCGRAQGVRPPPESRSASRSSASTGRSSRWPSSGRLMQEDTIAMAFSIMSARQKEKFKNNFEIDIAYSVPEPRALPLQHLPAARHGRPGPARHPGARS